MTNPFDELRFDEIWSTRTYLDLFGAEAAVEVVAEETGPAEWQRSIFDAFVRRQSALKLPVYEAVLKYYQTVAPDYRDRYESREEALRAVPHVNSAEDMRQILTPYGIVIRDLDPEAEEMGILFECDWEYEHGVGVLLRHWEIVEVGHQDVCL